jgi:hypothetical protein
MPVLRVFVPRGESVDVKYSLDFTNWLCVAWGTIHGDDREHVFTPAQWLTLGAERMFFRLEIWGKQQRQQPTTHRDQYGKRTERKNVRGSHLHR